MQTQTIPSPPPEFDVDAIRQHVALLHERAAGNDGVLVVSVFHASGASGTVTHHPIGDIDGMVDAVIANDGVSGANVYTGLHIMRRGLARGKRGTASDIVAVLGVVADLDADTGKIGAMPVEADFVLETSPGNCQPFILFEEPATAAEAAEIGSALMRASGADSGTRDPAHVWRIPGTLNWPNKAKIERGRSPEPTLVHVIEPYLGTLHSIADLQSALSPWSSSGPKKADVALGEIPDAASLRVSGRAAEMLAANDVGDRSRHAGRVVEQLGFDCHTAEEAAALFLSATGDWVLRYGSRDAMHIDFARLWEKFGASTTPSQNVAGFIRRSTEKRTPPVAANDNDPIDPWRKRQAPELPRSLLPPVIEEFATAQAELMGVDPGGLAMAALAVCAAAIPDSITIQPKRHDQYWQESARLWVALIGNPSTKKTPTMNAAVAPLRRLDRELFRQYEAAKQAYDALDKTERAKQSPPANVRLCLGDTTIEAAQDVLKHSCEGVLLIQDELSGWFGAMEKYSGGGRGAAADRGFWLQGFNGGAYSVNRVARGSSLIENLSVSLLGGIQPDPIRAIARDSHDDGLLQRLFPIVLQTARPGTDKPMPPVVATYDALVDRLHVLRKPLRGGIQEVPLRFDAGAQAVWEEVTVENFRLSVAWETVNKKLAAHVGKLDGLFARLCLTWHCIEAAGNRPASVITADTAERVKGFMREFLFPHAVTFYTDVLGLSDRQDELLATAGWLLAHRPAEVTAREIRRGDRVMRQMDTQTAEQVLEQLDAMRWLDPLPSPRRDSRRWRINPSVYAKFEERADAEEARRAEIREAIRYSLNDN